MSYNNAPTAPILIAVPDEWQSKIREFLEQKGYAVLTVASRDEALQIIQSQQLRGVITVSDWGMASEDGKTTGLIDAIRGRIPSVTLIRKTGSYRWFNEVFDPPFHEYCTTPFELDGLLAFMRRATMIPKDD